MYVVKNRSQKRSRMQTYDDDDDIVKTFWAHAKKMVSNINRERLFKQFFGLSPELTVVTWDVVNNPKIHPKILPKHLLWTLLFLKQYGNEGMLSSVAKVTPKTFRKWVWIVIDGLSSRYDDLVSNCFTFCLFIYFILFYFIFFYFI